MMNDDALQQILTMFPELFRHRRALIDTTDILAKLQEVPGLCELLAAHWQNTQLEEPWIGGTDIHDNDVEGISDDVE